MRQPAETSGRRRSPAIRHAPALLAFGLLAACVASDAPLNSERIESRFGSYGVELLPGEPGLRRSNLYSVHDGRRICRTYAVVQWRPAAAGQSAELAALQAEIESGASLGATLQAAGWRLDKRTRYVGPLPALAPPPGWLALMDQENSAGLAMHVYDLNIKKSGQSIEYARIIEVHHPDYLGPARLADNHAPVPGWGLDAAALAAVYALLTDPG